MSNYEEKEDDLFEKIKAIPITEYAVHMGYSLVRKGKYYSLLEHDSIMINTEKNIFWRNSGIGNNTSGSVIDFVMNLNGVSLSEAIQELESYGGVSEGKQYKRQEVFEQKNNDRTSSFLHLPSAGDTMKNVFAYLIKTRAIDPDVVKNFVERKMLYQDERANCVFVALENGKPVFGCLRGTNTAKRFVGDCRGSNYEKGFFINNNSQKVFVTESVIDAMSIMSILKAQGNNYLDYSYMVLTGTAKEDALINQVKTHNTKEVYLCMDNDNAGIDSIKRTRDKLMAAGIKDITVLLPEHKDWNEDIVKAKNIKDIELFDTKEVETDDTLIESPGAVFFEEWKNSLEYPQNTEEWWSETYKSANQIMNRFKNTELEEYIKKAVTDELNYYSEALKINEKMNIEEYEIYQINNNNAEYFNKYAFEGIKSLMHYELIKSEKDISISNYEQKWISHRDANKPLNLDDIFRKFNLDRPAEFTGHSLSVSDVIVVTDCSKRKYAYYVEPAGFKLLTDFFDSAAVKKEKTAADIKSYAKNMVKNMAAQNVTEDVQIRM